MATKLKVVEDVADIVPAPKVPDFEPAPTRKRHAGWTAERQRKFIERLALTGNAGDACASVGVASSSAYRLRNKAGAQSFARAWDAALRLCTTRLAVIGLDRAVNGRVERFYKDGELMMERRSPSARTLAAAAGDPREAARNSLPDLMATFENVPEEECPFEPIDYLDGRLGETGSGEPVSDEERG